MPTASSSRMNVNGKLMPRYFKITD